MIARPTGTSSRESELIGLAWHHVRHARICIERGTPWQAEWLISGAREHTGPGAVGSAPIDLEEIVQA